MSETGPQANWLLHGAAPSGHLPVWCRTRHVAARSAALNDSARLHQLMREGSPELPKYRHSAQMRQPLVLLGVSIADKVRRHIAVAVNCHRRDPEASQYR